MGQTVSLWSIDGVSKAKTAKAILVFKPDSGQEAWIPLSVASVRFIGKDYKVRVTVPSWFYGKIVWKSPAPYTPKKPENPYIGSDVGNMMEELMVLEEIYAAEGTQNGAIPKRIDMIKEALAQANAV